MMRNLDYFLFSLLLISQTSCSDNQEKDIRTNDFVGHYEIVSMTAEQPVDLNNDGVQSLDLYAEISTPYHLNNEETLIARYDFSQWSSYAEVRPTSLQWVDIKLIILSIPRQRIQSSFLNESPTIPCLALYDQVGDNYFYEFTPDDEIILQHIGSKSDESEEWGELPSLKRIDKNAFSVELKMKLFDFKSEKWIEISVVLVYSKRELEDGM